MNELYKINFEPENRILKVSGELTLNSVSTVLAETESMFDRIDDIKIDLADVTRSDSAGVALLIEWMRRAQRDNKSLQFGNLPEQIRAIASASGLEEFLPLQ